MNELQLQVTSGPPSNTVLFNFRWRSYFRRDRLWCVWSPTSRLHSGQLSLRFSWGDQTGLLLPLWSGHVPKGRLIVWCKYLIFVLHNLPHFLTILLANSLNKDVLCMNNDQVTIKWHLWLASEWHLHIFHLHFGKVFYSYHSNVRNQDVDKNLFQSNVIFVHC